MRRGSRRILVALVLVGGLLAGLVGWRARDFGASGHAPASRMQERATVLGPSTDRPATPRAARPQAKPQIPAVDCLAQRRHRLRGARWAMPPPTSAATAFDGLLLDDLIGSLAAGDPPRVRARRRAIADARWQEARLRWPRDLDIAWFAARSCAARRGCDRDEALRHLLALDGDNVAAWLLAMAYAPQEDDPSRYDRLLQRAAKARFNDPRIGTVFLHLQPILAAAPPPAACRGDDAEFAMRLGRAPTSEDWAAVEASAAEMAIGFASYASLSGCNPDEATLPPARRQDCMSVLRLVAEGDTVLERTLSLSLLIRLEGNGPRAHEWRERYRQLRWLTSVGPRLMDRDPRAETLWMQGEVEWLRQQAQAAGLWPPPPGWLPSDARGRSLILAGRVPPQHR